MATELEVKVRIEGVEGFARVRAALSAMGAVCLGVTDETNTFFDTATAELRGGDRGLRVRRNARAGRPDELVVTYKGPKQVVGASGGGFKSREEIEVVVDDYDRLVAMFGRLGFGVTLSFEKRRETWSLGEGTEVVLDTLPHLGTFAEIEAGSEQVIRDLLSALGLTDAPVVKESYIQLISQWVESQAPGTTLVRFGVGR